MDQFTKTSPMTLLVCGSRSWSDHLAIRAVLQRYKDLNEGDILVLSGGARGSDRLATVEAMRMGLHVAEINPIPNHYGQQAESARNSWLVRLADEMVAFWDGESPGTMDIIQKCTATGVPFTIYEPGD